MQLKCLAETARYKFWEIQVKFNLENVKFSFGATTDKKLNIYYGRVELRILFHHLKNGFIQRKILKDI